MKSPMVQNAKWIEDEDRGKYSELQVLQSNAGYYVGTIFTDGSFSEPGSRDSGYFKNREGAETLLKAINDGDETALRSLRLEP